MSTGRVAGDLTCSCGKPTSGAWLCADCAHTLEVAIANIGTYWADVETIQTKRARYGSGAATKGSIGKAQPLPIDGRFAEVDGTGTQAKWDTWNTIVTWCRVVMEEQPQLLGPACGRPCLHVSCAAIRRRRWPAANTVPSMCAYLDRQLSWLIREQYAPEVLDELTHIERRLERLVDRPPDRLYLGTCTAIIDGEECSGAVYAIEGEATGTCDQRDCEATYGVAESRAGLEDALDSRLCTASEIARLATYLGLSGDRERVRKRVNQWHVRKRIEAKRHDVEGRPMFAYGEVRSLLFAEFGTADTHEMACGS